MILNSCIVSYRNFVCLLTIYELNSDCCRQGAAGGSWSPTSVNGCPSCQGQRAGVQVDQWRHQRGLVAEVQWLQTRGLLRRAG